MAVVAALNSWGAAPTADYETLAAPFRPIFARIAEGAIARERGRLLPYEQIGWLKQSGFGALRVSKAEGGPGASLPDLFGLLIELSEADSNITQAIRAHFGWSEDIVNVVDAGKRARDVKRLLANQIAGSAWTEGGNAPQGAFATSIRRKDGKALLSGQKYYTTGSLFADWIDTGATDEDGTDITVLVSRHADGVEVVDDWDGFGQILTASGTTIFTDVEVDPDDVVPSDDKFKYGAAFYQLVHLATLAGIGRAIHRDVATAVAARTRSFSNGNGNRAAQDPQVLQVVGRIRSNAYAASSLVIQAARALQKAFETRHGGDPAADDEANILAELEVAQIQNVVIELTLESATRLFDTLGASSTKSDLALDRHWRNARTLASHNPRIYKERIIGDWSVNGTSPPFQWRIGIPAA